MKMSKIAILLAALVTVGCMDVSTVRAQGQYQGQNQGQYQGQGLPSGVSMTMYRLGQAPDGRQYFFNNHNQQVYLPGDGVNGNEISIYTGPKGGVWYVDRNNQPKQISGPQQGSTGGAPVTNNYYQSGNSNSSGGSNGGGAAMGAAVGMAAGTALGATMANSSYPTYPAYRGAVPYGTAMYYDNHNKPYYMNNGNRTYVNNDVTVNNDHFNNWQKQNDVYNRNVVNESGAWHGNYTATQADYAHGAAYHNSQTGINQAGINQAGEAGLFHHEQNNNGEGGGFLNRDGNAAQAAGREGLLNRDGNAAGREGLLNRDGNAAGREGLLNRDGNGGRLGGGRFRRGR